MPAGLASAPTSVIDPASPPVPFGLLLDDGRLQLVFLLLGAFLLVARLVIVWPRRGYGAQSDCSPGEPPPE